nr:MAG TPA: hypothetical protein [Caudoviricetes sp.]
MAAHIMNRGFMRLALANLNVITMHCIKTNF